MSATELEGQVEDDLIRWGAWARGGGFAALGWPRRKVTHERMDKASDDDVLAEQVEIAVLSLPRHLMRVVKLRYVYRWPCHQLGKAVRRSRRSVYRDLAEARRLIAGRLYGTTAELMLRLSEYA